MSQKSSLLFDDLQKSVVFLESTIAQPYNDYMRAAAILSFEICFELAWKYLRARLGEATIEAYSPKATFRESGKAGLLDNVENWLEFVKQRNLTVHTYNGQLADDVYASIKNDFLPAATRLLQTANPQRDF